MTGLQCPARLLLENAVLGVIAQFLGGPVLLGLFLHFCTPLLAANLGGAGAQRNGGKSHGQDGCYGPDSAHVLSPLLAMRQFAPTNVSARRIEDKRCI
jgi:hypothetical protein